MALVGWARGPSFVRVLVWGLTTPLAVSIVTCMETTETFPLTPRERSDSMFWLVGSRDYFGAAYFVTAHKHDNGEVWLWRSNRPYGVNDRIARVPSIHLTVADVEAALVLS